jgi:hypothetical protein
MSHSLRRATARIRCRGVCVKRLVNGSVLVKAPLHQQPSLRAAFEKQSIEQQQDHGADDRHNPAGDIITARKDATDPRANQRAGDAEQNRNDATTGISSRHQQLCDRTDNKTNEYGPND